MSWQAGDRLTVRASDWRVVRSTAFDECVALNLASEAGRAPRTLLLPFDRPRRAQARRLRVVSRRRWAREVADLIRGSYPFGGLRSCPSAIRLMAYQLEPALAMLRHGALRMLIADEVGLGKTVEAGLLVREIAAADHFARTLILCPAGLRAQWARELDVLFELHAIEADARWLREASSRFPPDVNPWSPPGVYLSSIDFVKRPEALHPLEDVRWDLLVVDEAHAATPTSNRRAAVDALARRARRIVLLTATPHSGDDEQFAALCALGTGSRASSMVLFNRSRTDVRLGDHEVRSSVLPVRPTDAERRCHELLDAYTTRVWIASTRRGDGSARLIATVLRKRALSSAASLAVSVRRRLALIGSGPRQPDQLPLPLEDEDMARDAAPDWILAARGLDDETEERRALVDMLDVSEAAAADESKLRVLLRLLRRIKEPAIVFSEYRDTVERLHAHLSQAGHAACLLHGGLTPHERRRALALFGSGGRHLIATDAASEGLNLHHTCRLVIHFELPWSSSRLQQRTGRVNRIGQTRRVHEIALVGAHSAERLVLVPLLRRATRSRRFLRTSLAEQLTEAAVAERIIGGAPPPADEPVPVQPSLKVMDLQSEAEAEVERLLGLRRLQGRKERPRPRARPSRIVPVTTSRGAERSASTTAQIVITITLQDASGIVEQTLAALSVSIPPLEPRVESTPLKNEIERALHVMRPRVDAIGLELARARAAHAGPLRDRCLAALHERERELQTGLRSTARELVQAGLFDRRAMRSSERRQWLLDSLGQDAHSHLRWIEAAQGQLQATYEIRAVMMGALS